MTAQLLELSSTDTQQCPTCPQKITFRRIHNTSMEILHPQPPCAGFSEFCAKLVEKLRPKRSGVIHLHRGYDPSTHCGLLLKDGHRHNVETDLQKFRATLPRLRCRRCVAAYQDDE